MWANCRPPRRHRAALAEKARQKVLAESLIRLSGGVESLTLTHALLGDEGAKRLASALQANETVRWLHLDGNHIGDAGVSDLARVLATNTQVRVLDLDFNVIRDDGASALAEALLHNRSLQELDLHFNSIGSAGAMKLAEALETNGILESLSLHGNSIGDVGAGRLAKALQKNTGLKALHLGNSNIGDDGALQFAEALEINRVLWALHLESNQIGDAGAMSIAAAVLSNPALGELWLLKNKIGVAGARELSRCLRKPGSLRKLGLTISDVKDSDRAALLGDFSKKHILRRAARKLADGAACLDLNGKALGDEGVRELIDEIKSNKHLKELHLKKNGISDAGVEQLAQALLTCTNMEKISLAKNDIGDAGAAKLALVLDMPSSQVMSLDSIAPGTTPKVKELDLEHNLIGDVGAMKLAEAVEKNAYLERLSLNGNSISDTAISRLMLARENSSTLRELTLDEQLGASIDVSGRKDPPEEALEPGEHPSEGCPVRQRKLGIEDLDNPEHFKLSLETSLDHRKEPRSDPLKRNAGDAEAAEVDGGDLEFPSVPDDALSGFESIRPAGQCDMVFTTMKQGLLSGSPPPALPDLSLEDEPMLRQATASSPLPSQPLPQLPDGSKWPLPSETPPLPALQDDVRLMLPSQSLPPSLGDDEKPLLASQSPLPSPQDGLISTLPSQSPLPSREEDAISGIGSIPTDFSCDLVLTAKDGAVLITDDAPSGVESSEPAEGCGVGLTSASSISKSGPGAPDDEDACSADGLECGYPEQGTPEQEVPEQLLAKQSIPEEGRERTAGSQMPNLDEVSERVELPQSSEAPFAFGFFPPLRQYNDSLQSESSTAIGDEDVHWRGAAEITTPKLMSL